METSRWFSRKTAIPFAGIFLVVFYLSEAYSKFAIYFMDGKSAIPRVIKLAVMVFLAVALLKKNIRLLLSPVLLAISFAIGQFFLENGFQPTVVVNFGKYLFPIFLFLYFTEYPLDEDRKNLFFKILEAMLLVNSALILIGFLFGIPLFSSYPNERFGYDGLFIASATGSYVYMISIFYFLFSLKRKFFANWKVWFTIATALLIGTKTLYLGIILAALSWVLFYAELSKKSKALVFSGIAIILLGIGYFFFFEYGIFNEIRQESGLADALFSYRNDLLMNHTLPFIENHWDWGNYLFGGIVDLSTKSQLEAIDIFYFWGLLGGLFYLYTFYKSCFPFRLIKQELFVFVGFLALVFLAGNFFVNASLAIWLLVLRESLKKGP